MFSLKHEGALDKKRKKNIVLWLFNANLLNKKKGCRGGYLSCSHGCRTFQCGMQKNIQEQVLSREAL